MKIFFDARWVRMDYHDGISRYSTGLIQGFKDSNIPITVLIYDLKQLEKLPKDTPYILINNPVSIRELFTAYKLNKYKPDVVFSPMQVMGWWGRKYKLILTLQDIIYYKYPKPPTNLPLFIRIIWRLFHMTRWPQRFLLTRADYNTTVSKQSRKFIREYNLTNRKIGVIYNATSLKLPTKTSQSKTTKNIIYMGSFMPYKNVELLIKGMSLIPEGYTLHLLSKIAEPRKTELSALIKPGVNVVFHNGVSDEEYLDLLKDAFCLAMPSKQEGFGLPIVESQTIGTPVLCSDMDIFHEVAGDGALYFNYDKPKEFADQIIKLNDPKILNDLVSKGHTQAAKFSWAHSAQVLYNICEKLCK